MTDTPTDESSLPFEPTPEVNLRFIANIDYPSGISARDLPVMMAREILHLRKENEKFREALESVRNVGLDNCLCYSIANEALGK